MGWVGDPSFWNLLKGSSNWANRNPLDIHAYQSAQTNSPSLSRSGRFYRKPTHLTFPVAPGEDRWRSFLELACTKARLGPADTAASQPVASRPSALEKGRRQSLRPLFQWLLKIPQKLLIREVSWAREGEKGKGRARYLRAPVGKDLRGHRSAKSESWSLFPSPI